MAKPRFTKKEREWFDKLQRVLDECPFNTSEYDSYTIGDSDVTVFKKRSEVDQHQREHCCDIHQSVSHLDAEVYSLKFPFGVASAAG